MDGKGVEHVYTVKTSFLSVVFPFPTLFFVFAIGGYSLFLWGCVSSSLLYSTEF
jgi:hypothetical protein